MSTESPDNLARIIHRIDGISRLILDSTDNFSLLQLSFDIQREKKIGYEIVESLRDILATP